MSKAISDFSQALEINPKFEDAYTNRGMAWFALKDFDKAIADYSRALELDPKDAYAYNDRGWAWQAKRDYEKALEDFDQALRFRPRFVRALTNRGIVLTAKKEFDRAVEDFDHAIEIDPQRARTYTSRGIALGAKGQYERAIDDFNRALHINPRDTWTQYNRLVAYLDAHRGDTATEARRFLDQTGWNHELALHTAVIGHFAAKRNGQANEARRFLDEAAIRADSRQWTYQLIRFLRGEINEQALLSSAGDAARMTEIHCFVGLHDTLSGHNEAALPHFRWVRDKGLTSFAEYRIALAELDRIERKPRDDSVKRRTSTGAQSTLTRDNSGE